jgi:hypothetical protein
MRDFGRNLRFYIQTRPLQENLMKTTNQLRKIAVALVVGTCAAHASAQSAFLDLNTLPTLTCKNTDFKGPVISPAGAPSGKGPTDQIPNIFLPSADVKGRAYWTYTAPNDGINRVRYGVALPNAAALQYNLSYVPAGSGYNQSLPTEFRVVVVAGTVTATTSNAVIANPVLFSSTQVISITDALQTALAGRIDVQADEKTIWSVLIQEARNVTNPTANNPNWVQTNVVCQLPMSVAIVF